MFEATEPCHLLLPEVISPQAFPEFHIQSFP